MYLFYGTMDTMTKTLQNELDRQLRQLLDSTRVSACISKMQN